MDKKKVKELIEQILKYCDQCYNPNWQPKSFEEFVKLGHICREAIKELSKSDWISVEDRLPEYDERVLVYSKYKELYWISHRMKDVRIRKDHNGFIHPLKDCAITHWKPIEKLEE